MGKRLFIAEKPSVAQEFAKALNLDRITAPVIVRSDSGINDDLNGVERKVKFDIKETNEEKHKKFTGVSLIPILKNLSGDMYNIFV